MRIPTCFAACLLLLGAVITSPICTAQSAASGKILFNTAPAPGRFSCSNGACHGPSPALRQNSIQKGANNPSVIAAAINGGVPDMLDFRGLFTGSQLADLAAYIANPGVSGGAPSASLSVTSVSFPTTTVGVATATQTVTITNSGTASLVINAFAITSPDFVSSVNTCSPGASIAPGASCVITVRFTPSAAGPITASLLIAHNANPATTTIALSGIGVAPVTSHPIALLNESALVLPSTPVGAVASGVSITLANTGTAPLQLTSVATAPAEFRIASSNCVASPTLAVGAHCTVLVTFAPTAVGERSGTVTFNHNAAPASNLVALSATGTAAPTTTPPTRVMVEYLYTPLNYYFVTSRDSDKTLLDSAATFQRTGASFLVYASQLGEMRGISRFYFDQVAKAGGRGSHYYTLLDADLLALADQNPGHSKAAGLAQNEGIDSFAYLPAVTGVGGSCPNGLMPVYRLFRGNTKFPDDPNHRFITSITLYNEFVAAGWDGEGVNFCVPAP